MADSNDPPVVVLLERLTGYVLLGRQALQHGRGLVSASPIAAIRFRALLACFRRVYAVETVGGAIEYQGVSIDYDNLARKRWKPDS